MNICMFSLCSYECLLAVVRMRGYYGPCWIKYGCPTFCSRKYRNIPKLLGSTSTPVCVKSSHELYIGSFRTKTQKPDCGSPSVATQFLHPKIVIAFQMGQLKCRQEYCVCDVHLHGWTGWQHYGLPNTACGILFYHNLIPRRCAHTGTVCTI